MLTLERYLESDKGICSPVTGLIRSLGARRAQGLAVEAERAFLRAATARGPGLWLRNRSRAAMSASSGLAGCDPLFSLSFPQSNGEGIDTAGGSALLFSPSCGLCRCRRELSSGGDRPTGPHRDQERRGHVRLPVCGRAPSHAGVAL